MKLYCQSYCYNYFETPVYISEHFANYVQAEKNTAIDTYELMKTYSFTFMYH